MYCSEADRRARTFPVLVLVEPGEPSKSPLLRGRGRAEASLKFFPGLVDETIGGFHALEGS